MIGNAQAIAVVGLGAMGLPMSRRLLSAGFEVRGFDRSGDAMARFGRAGGIAHISAAAAARGAAALLLLVINDAQAEDVLFGADGAAGALPSGAVVILSLTTAPSKAAHIGSRLEGMGLCMVDCPVSGGVKRAENGTLSLIASGSLQGIEAARRYLAPLGVLRVVGDRHGQAASIKLVNQLLCGIHIAAAAEAVALAEKAGIDLRLLYDVINASSGASAMFADRAPMMLQEGERTTAAIDILVKDLGLVADLGARLHARLPLAQGALAFSPKRRPTAWGPATTARSFACCEQPGRIDACSPTQTSPPRHSQPRQRRSPRRPRPRGYGRTEGAGRKRLARGSPDAGWHLRPAPPRGSGERLR